MDRRDLLRSSVALGAMLAGGRRAWTQGSRGYGPLVPARDETTGLPLLRLPEGFGYRSFGWEGDPMRDGSPTPDRHDGMALLAGGDAESFVLMRNHERALVPVFGPASVPVYDAYASPPGVAGIGGGTTALVFAGGRYAETVPTLTGTVLNCAGGPTPWGSWLTCEEMILTGGRTGTRHHGYVFEVPRPGQAAASARPVIEMGRMKHEAVAIDAATGFVYLTEDNGPSGFYRFRPNAADGGLGTLEQGGILEMLKLIDRPDADLGAPHAGDLYPVEWVPIGDPDADAERNEMQRGGPVTLGLGRSGPFLQGQAQGAASFRRLEGCFAHGGLIYFTDTIGGQALRGVVWALAPAAAAAADDEPDLLRCVFVSAGEHEADNIDNLCVSPRGGIVLCEDGGGIRENRRLIQGTRIVGLGADGTGAFALAENNLLLGNGVPSREWIAPGDYRGSEFAGACFSPTGDALFVNIQTPGVTFEIRGPWERGAI